MENVGNRGDIFHTHTQNPGRFRSVLRLTKSREESRSRGTWGNKRTAQKHFFMILSKPNMTCVQEYAYCGQSFLDSLKQVSHRFALDSHCCTDLQLLFFFVMVFQVSSCSFFIGIQRLVVGDQASRPCSLHQFRTCKSPPISA